VPGGIKSVEMEEIGRTEKSKKLDNKIMRAKQRNANLTTKKKK
jgi:hypothetical protein